ncbi:MAG: hypothetical protein IIT46_07025 [Lachnospiraceae bacterium]|nr:hypothetical protein [Lachnospiraceae bacterium]
MANLSRCQAPMCIYYNQARYYNATTASFISKDVVKGSVFEIYTLNRYNYCWSNPIKYVDPSGYYTTVEGIAAHVALQTYFMEYYSTRSGTPKIEYKVPGIVTNKSGTGRADMVLIRSTVIEVYEIKPITYRSNPGSNLAGKEQLTGYVNGLNKREKTKKASNRKKVKRGGRFSTVVNLLKLPLPIDPTRTISYYTFKDDPGMIYYAISPKKKPQTAPVTEKEKEKSKNTVRIKVNPDSVCDGVKVAGGVAAATYVAYRVVRLLPSCTPATWWTLPANVAIP